MSIAERANHKSVSRGLSARWWLMGLACVWLAAAGGVRGGDWPQWRYDAGRGAATPDALPERLSLSWTRQLAEPCPAWPASQPRLRFDVSYSPVAAGKRLYVPSMVTDSVTALDTETGRRRWQFYADGPVRFAPIVAEGRVYFASDDGYLYCLDAAGGRLVWRVRGGPTDRRVLGSGRLISTWPIHGGPVLLDGNIYFTAGIWPFMGIFVHAVDAATGGSIWINSGEAMRYVVQPHDSPAFGSFVPRGHLAATPYGLVAPGGRTDPAVYDLKTGKMLHFDFGAKGTGSCEVAALGPWFFVQGTMRRMADGQLQSDASAGVYEGNTLYALAGDLPRGGSRLVAREIRTEYPEREKGDSPSWSGGCHTAGVAAGANRSAPVSPGGHAGAKGGCPPFPALPPDRAFADAVGPQPAGTAGATVPQGRPAVLCRGRWPGNRLGGRSPRIRQSPRCLVRLLRGPALDDAGRRRSAVRGHHGRPDLRLRRGSRSLLPEGT